MCFTRVHWMYSRTNVKIDLLKSALHPYIDRMALNPAHPSGLGPAKCCLMSIIRVSCGLDAKIILLEPSTFSFRFLVCCVDIHDIYDASTFESILTGGCGDIVLGVKLRANVWPKFARNRRARSADLCWRRVSSDSLFLSSSCRRLCILFFPYSSLSARLFLPNQR